MERNNGRDGPADLISLSDTVHTLTQRVSSSIYRLSPPFSIKGAVGRAGLKMIGDFCSCAFGKTKTEIKNTRGWLGHPNPNPRYTCLNSWRYKTLQFVKRVFRSLNINVIYGTNVQEAESTLIRY